MATDVPEHRFVWRWRDRNDSFALGAARAAHFCDECEKTYRAGGVYGLVQRQRNFDDWSDELGSREAAFRASVRSGKPEERQKELESRANEVRQTCPGCIVL